MAIIKKGGRTGLVKKGSGLRALRRAKNRGRDTDKAEQLILVLDASYSMEMSVTGRVARNGTALGKTKINAAREAARGLIMASRQSDVGLVSFSTEGYTLCLLDEGRERCLMSLERYKPSGGTQIREGLRAALNAFDIEDPAKVRRIVLMTDGRDFDGGYGVSEAEVGNRQQQVDRAKAEGIIIDCVAFGHDADLDDLAKISGATGGVVRSADDASELAKEFKQLEAGIRGLIGSGD
jgi:Mg-chelatase subunit ChlD